MYLKFLIMKTLEQVLLSVFALILFYVWQNFFYDNYFFEVNVERISVF